MIYHSKHKLGRWWYASYNFDGGPRRGVHRYRRDIKRTPARGEDPAGSMAGMLLSAALAVLLTPLDRYVSLIYSLTGWGSFIIGFALLIVFYIIALHKTQKEDLK